MPGGGGLRKCKCGQFYLLREATALGLEAGPETPHTQFVDAADLADATQSPHKAVELVAYRQYWMQLNDPYRDLYRAQQKTEDQAAQEKCYADCYTSNSDKRSARQQLAPQGTPWGFLHELITATIRA